MPQVDEIATVVVCDGDQPTLDLLCEHLVDDRFNVLPASSGTDALRLCRFNHPDILILDLSPPDMAGSDVVERIRAGDGVDGRIAPNLPIIVLSGPGAGGRHALSRDSGPTITSRSPSPTPN